jgi:cobalt-precorrin-5B (C1)-methyltransferase
MSDDGSPPNAADRDDGLDDLPDDVGTLRRGWTTGACATAATRAALQALLGMEPDDPIPVTLPAGPIVHFALATLIRGDGVVAAGVIKDAGDDPDVTHGALVTAEVRWGPPGSGLTFEAGEGVGMVTLPGLPIPPGEPAINPVPRQMMIRAVADVTERADNDVVLRIGVENGRKLAERTMNGRLGIVGGLSILGTTGIVIPFSCAAWIHSIHRGIDVARAAGITHVAGSTGSTSEEAVRALYGLADQALIDMGDFAGGMLKYLRKHPVPRVTIAGGIAKMAKLGQGMADLHSARGGVAHSWLAARMRDAGGDDTDCAVALSANTVLQVHEHAASRQLPFAEAIAHAARETAVRLLANEAIALDVCVFDRDGRLIGRAG